MTPTFRGPLASEFSRFAQQMRAVGGRHVTLFATVKRLDKFLAYQHPETSALSREVVSSWFASFDQLAPASQQRYRTATFQLCKSLRGREPRTATREDFEPLRRSRSFQPHIFSQAEIAELLRAARALPPRPSDPLRPWTIELAFVLLYTAGLRGGEVARLDNGDYDCDEGTLLIRETKFAKTRLVPLSSSARQIVDHYAQRRRDLALSHLPTDSLLWPLRHGGAGLRPNQTSLQAALVRVMRNCGLKPSQGRSGPRIHDIRHTFAVHRVLEWYRAGVDVQARLPHLSTYMGHRSLESTQRYLSVIPDVLHEASVRFGRLARVDGSEETVPR